MAKTVSVIRPAFPVIFVMAATLAAGFANLRKWRSLKAKQLYLAQCDLALANPSLSSPDADGLDPENGKLGGSSEAFERYEWYVARLIYVLDECLKLEPNGQWDSVAKTQLGSHKKYLASRYYESQDYLSHYSVRMRALIKLQRNG